MIQSEILPLLQRITAIDPSARFVGTIILNYHGLQDAKDIDIVTNDVDIYSDYLTDRWQNPSPLCPSGERGFGRFEGYNIDLFQRQESVDPSVYEVIEGVKLNTPKDMLRFHRDLMSKFIEQPLSIGRDVKIVKQNQKIKELQNIIIT